eukprot:SAG31_NODE_867_length_11367_cov_25.365992_7_plen_57_part_00
MAAIKASMRWKKNNNNEMAAMFSKQFRQTITESVVVDVDSIDILGIRDVGYAGCDG